MTDSPRKTLQDIADAAGLSKAATSYALRGIRGSEKTQAKVRALADELGYSVDPIARALANGRSGNVAIVGSLRDMWRQGLAVMLSEALRENELASIIADVDSSPKREQEVLQALAGQRVDGAIALPVDPSAEYWGTVPADIRIVSIGDALSARPDAGCVLFDNEYGVGTALQHLADLGHRSVGLLAPSLPTTPGRPAELLARNLGDSMGLSVRVAYSPSTVTGAARAARELLAVTSHPTALFCLGDSIAFGAYSACRALGLAVPTDISILGFDDSELAPLVTPELTTFGWDEQAIVDAAVHSLAGDDPARVMFRPEFLQRGSTAPPPADPAPSR
ncbi:LacI family DNA-binding transcriptional regulator [Arthrobacter sp. H5]|uniref:LacI family DNA-binding transcriptional regulator n=1 Tax=Arthrobacter sp. H5 TaxID=1267973 RepID=UPI0004834DFF|nr:LacI family DNA-binding transcriptional regulator [Arthrobacter sp. H5]